MVVRRLTLATRKHLARLARLRQGPDGKWETNRKKQALRKVRRGCARIGEAFSAAGQRHAAEEAEGIASASALARELESVKDAATLRGLFPKLEAVFVTSAVLRRSGIIAALLDAARRCRSSRNRNVVRLLARWRETYRRRALALGGDASVAAEGRRCSRKRKSPEAAAAAADAAKASAETAVVEKASIEAGGVGESPAPFRKASPASLRHLNRPSQKLGKVFAKVRERNAADEAVGLDAARALARDLDAVASTPELRARLPRAEALRPTAALLRETPVLQALVDAAKRCRKGKDEQVIRLLASWRQVLERADEAAATPAVAVAQARREKASEAAAAAADVAEASEGGGAVLAPSSPLDLASSPAPQARRAPPELSPVAPAAGAAGARLRPGRPKQAKLSAFGVQRCSEVSK
eukprot:TRINITY_DN1185_c2_g1_i1.p2 TRINITY_DN1185_c2_g1~~TRINITY_DN1185_c2_g1_i1.p2  ORF type:complete len:412 (-),score=119.61 TRINITY_DN1185_c2_g1_i1:153-1388(-)